MGARACRHIFLVSELLFPVVADGSMPFSDDEASVAPQHMLKSRSRRAIAKENFLMYVFAFILGPTMPDCLPFPCWFVNRLTQQGQAFAYLDIFVLFSQVFSER
jgi:hypothetical protein